MNYRKKKTILIKRCEVWKTHDVKVPQLIKQPHFSLEKTKMIATCLALNGAKTTTFKCNGSLPRMWNKQVADIVIRQSSSVSFHDGVVDIVP